MRRNKIQWDEPSLLLFLLRLGCSAAAQSNQSFTGDATMEPTEENMSFGKGLICSVSLSKIHGIQTVIYFYCRLLYHLKLGKKKIVCWKIKWTSKAAHDYKPPCKCKSIGITSNEFCRIRKQLLAWIPFWVPNPWFTKNYQCLIDVFDIFLSRGAAGLLQENAQTNVYCAFGPLCCDSETKNVAQSQLLAVSAFPNRNATLHLHAQIYFNLTFHLQVEPLNFPTYTALSRSLNKKLAHPLKATSGGDASGFSAWIRTLPGKLVGCWTKDLKRTNSKKYWTLSVENQKNCWTLNITTYKTNYLLKWGSARSMLVGWREDFLERIVMQMVMMIMMMMLYLNRMKCLQLVCSSGGFG